MKKGLHPEYFECEAHCACGNTFMTGSTKKELKVEICSECHPFFTGKQKLIDTGGRVDRFKKRYETKQYFVSYYKTKTRPEQFCYTAGGFGFFHILALERKLNESL